MVSKIFIICFYDNSYWQWFKISLLNNPEIVPLFLAKQFKKSLREKNHRTTMHDSISYNCFSAT